MTNAVPTYPGWWWLDDAPILVWRRSRQGLGGGGLSDADLLPLWVTLPGSIEVVRVYEVDGWGGPCLREAR